MADDENERNVNRGTEWEVVSLTASTYAAAPGPKEFHNDENELSTAEEPPRAMFMSDHFLFEPCEHENLSLEPDTSEIHNEPGNENVETVECALSFEGLKPDKLKEENSNIKDMTEVDDQHVFLDEKGERLSLSSMNFQEGKDMRGPDLLEDHALYSSAEYSSLHAEDNRHETPVFEVDTTVEEDLNPSQLDSDMSSHSLKSQDTFEEDKPDLPCEAWWKRQAASIYYHAKEANTFWSVMVAAAVMGLVILGQRWQQERWQHQNLKWQFGFNDKNMNRMLSPIVRFKAALVGGHPRIPVIQGSASTKH